MKKLSVAWSGICATKHRISTDWQLSEFANKYGMGIVPIEDSGRFGHVEINYSPFRTPKNLRGIAQNRTVLLALEPQAVLPIQHRNQVRQKFGIVLVTSPLQRTLPSDEYFDFGLVGETPGSGIRAWGLRANSVALLNANKISWVAGNNYGLRRNVVRIIARNGLQVHIGGQGWDNSILSELKMNLVSLVSCVMQGEVPAIGTYSLPLMEKTGSRVIFHGEVGDAIEFLQKHRFCLVIENDSRYVSEKLFQAISAGCIPLYIGPRLSDFGLPSGLVIHISADNRNTLADALSNLEAQRETRETGRRFLADNQQMLYWSHRSGIDRFFQRVSFYLNQQPH